MTARTPGLLCLHGTGTAAKPLIAAGDHPGRPRPEAAWAHPCAPAPTPASSSKDKRHRLNPHSDRQASSHPTARAHAGPRTKESQPTTEITRCLNRYAARKAHPHLQPGPSQRPHPGAARPHNRLPHPCWGVPRTFADRPRPTLPCPQPSTHPRPGFQVGLATRRVLGRSHLVLPAGLWALSCCRRRRLRGGRYRG